MKAKILKLTENQFKNIYKSLHENNMSYEAYIKIYKHYFNKTYNVYVIETSGNLFFKEINGYNFFPEEVEILK